MNRTDRITEHFTEHFEYIGAIPTPVPLKEWADTVAEQNNLRVQLGFRRVEVDNGIAYFCPELINATTAHLDEEEFDAYCDAMQWAVDHEITLEDKDLEEATAAADAKLAELAPASLRLLTSVQMKWLDRQAGA